MDKLQKMGGIAAISEAIIYISAFIFFGAFWHFPAEANFVQQLDFLRENQASLYIVNLCIYVFFGIILAVLVLALHERLKAKSKVLSQISALFGLIWVGLVIASGMISNIGLNAVLVHSATDPEQAWSVWLTVKVIAEGIGGGNEIVGGLWVLLLSIAALKSNALSKKLNYLGIFVGATGVLTVYPAEVLTAIFGLSQIVWFLWLGLVLFKKPNQSNSS